MTNLPIAERTVVIRYNEHLAGGYGWKLTHRTEEDGSTTPILDVAADANSEFARALGSLARHSYLEQGVTEYEQVGRSPAIRRRAFRVVEDQ